VSVVLPTKGAETRRKKGRRAPFIDGLLVVTQLQVGVMATAVYERRFLHQMAEQQLQVEDRQEPFQNE
jgi:hypothetical protein